MGDGFLCRCVGGRCGGVCADVQEVDVEVGVCVDM